MNIANRYYYDLIKYIQVFFSHINWLSHGVYNYFRIEYEPPRQAPNANAQTSGCKGRFSAFFSANEIAIFTIIVVNGILSTNAEAMAET